MGDALDDYYARIDEDDTGGYEPFPCLCEECERERERKDDETKGDDDER